MRARFLYARALGFLLCRDEARTLQINSAKARAGYIICAPVFCRSTIRRRRTLGNVRGQKATWFVQH